MDSQKKINFLAFLAAYFQYIKMIYSLTFKISYFKEVKNWPNQQTNFYFNI